MIIYDTVYCATLYLLVYHINLNIPVMHGCGSH